VGTVGDLSSVGVLVLQVTFDATDAFLYQTLPLLLLLVISVLGVGDLVLFFKIRRASVPAPQPVWLVALALVLALMVVLQAPAQSYAKCPGLPGVGSPSNSPSFMATEILLTEVSIIVVLAYLFLRGYLTLKKLEKNRPADAGD